MVNEKDKELEKKLRTWFENQKYLTRIEILLEAYSKKEYSIYFLEKMGLSNMWKSLSLEKRKSFMESYEKDKSKNERRR